MLSTSLIVRKWKPKNAILMTANVFIFPEYSYRAIVLSTPRNKLLKLYRELGISIFREYMLVKVISELTCAGIHWCDIAVKTAIIRYEYRRKLLYVLFNFSSHPSLIKGLLGLYTKGIKIWDPTLHRQFFLVSIDRHNNLIAVEFCQSRVGNLRMSNQKVYDAFCN
ncbi:hypothetical protein PHYBLDRAFT_61236 [Phycomyces blakesleeanus NRRL 1555(-)]|uniref:Uncharacterized protein n=1 Tax=Phycomyces blakesleeanus (strain ATCC 8743b / DSM 1359 / FGSC 10004 / NBRC 33097 / NRRL 1555) TaxID=763407 RepID=A0A163ANM2_PHYB8|nr:hypothetical protein PHYBLDRAFT_61236 [Phycomyces blakesleeanus NRRL 1555(-)]OAD74711.1 hypothetical protein PHYBLDRAFT_61236 [Phycomyces blakesleeanus NRRL 1555(-)]|eukprot:XP_018292751.1 hypothetical protein PHYBLDRAFT_61236 [Phycomyces blakesleeanus NRRL 1555(-)]